MKSLITVFLVVLNLSVCAQQSFKVNTKEKTKEYTQANLEILNHYQIKVYYDLYNQDTLEVLSAPRGEYLHCKLNKSDYIVKPSGENFVFFREVGSNEIYFFNNPTLNYKVGKLVLNLKL